MEQSRNGGGRVVAFDEAMIGRHRTGSLSMYLDTGRDVDAGHVLRPSLQPQGAVSRRGRDVDAGRELRPSLQPQGAVSRRRTYADGELDVFTAERYFKGAMDGDRRKEDGVVAAAVPPPPAPLETPPASGRPALAVAKPAGTRASAAASVSASSATSANSRTMLLRHRRDHREKKCCVRVGALVRSCSGKRSVRVDSGVAKEVVPAGSGEPTAAASKIDWYKELRMQKAAHGIGSNRAVVTAAALPPNLNLGTAKVAAIGRDQVIREDKPVAEFFTSSSSRRRSFTLVAPVRASVLANEHNEDDDDDGAGSESSSDLFEIKSLMIDDCPYEPSEASIQWSVATAPADAASERGHRVSARWMTGGGGHRGRDGGRGPVAGRRNRDRPAALLSGCVSHRAVEVSAAPTAVPNAPRRHGAGFQEARNVA